MRFILAIFAVWVAIALFPEQPRAHANGSITEKVWLSRSCTDSRWYLASSDETTATLECDSSAVEDGD